MHRALKKFMWKWASSEISNEFTVLWLLFISPRIDWKTGVDSPFLFTMFLGKLDFVGMLMLIFVLNSLNVVVLQTKHECLTLSWLEETSQHGFSYVLQIVVYMQQTWTSWHLLSFIDHSWNCCWKSCCTTITDCSDRQFHTHNALLHWPTLYLTYTQRTLHDKC